MLRHSFSFCKTVATYYHNNSCDTSSMESRLFLERVNKCFVTQHVTDLTTDNSVLDLIFSRDPDTVQNVLVNSNFHTSEFQFKHS